MDYWQIKHASVSTWIEYLSSWWRMDIKQEVVGDISYCERLASCFLWVYWTPTLSPSPNGQLPGSSLVALN